MRIEVINVSTPEHIPTARGGYNTIEVAYKGEDGKVTGKKLLDFASPQAYETLKGVQSGAFTVEMSKKKGKDGKDYWQWDKVSAAGDSQPVSEGNSGESETAARPSRPGRPAGRGTEDTRRTYETPDERAVNRAAIINQSTLNMALQFHAHPNNPASSEEQVITTARKFRDYVLADLDALSAALKTAAKV